MTGAGGKPAFCQPVVELIQNYSRIIIGVAVVLAVVLDQFNHWLAKRRLAARAGHS